MRKCPRSLWPDVGTLDVYRHNGLARQRNVVRRTSYARAGPILDAACQSTCSLETQPVRLGICQRATSSTVAKLGANHDQNEYKPSRYTLREHNLAICYGFTNIQLLRFDLAPKG